MSYASFRLRAAAQFSHVLFLSASPSGVRADGAMRTMSVEKLLKGMPTLQSQIDALLDFEVSDSQQRHCTRLIYLRRDKTQEINLTRLNHVFHQ